MRTHARSRSWIMLLAIVAIAFLPATTVSGAGKKPKKPRPPSRSRIEHIVVVMMENRSFDHLLGWHPTADAMQDGLSYLDQDGTAHATQPLAPDYMGCEHPDPDHSYDGGRVQYNGGAMDGFLRSGDNDEYAIGYYVQDDRPFFNSLALAYTTLDRSFSSILGPTYPNRIFHHAAQTDRLDNSLDSSTLPTIWDRLIARGISAKYYFSDLSFLDAFWEDKYDSISHGYDEFLADAENGDLPAVAFIDPKFLFEQLGTCESDHPHCDIREGDAFLAKTFNAVASSPDWPTTVFIVTYDEWGGFFDHVPPPRAAAPNDVDSDIVDGKALLGFRVPTVVASPYSKGDPANPRVVSTVFDHTSILKLIEWRWRLTPLTARDASNDVGNLVEVLNRKRFDPSLPDLPTPSSPNIDLCLIP